MSELSALKNMLYSNGRLKLTEQISLILLMTAPAVLAQISSVFMQYIDCAMIARVGSTEAAAIGLVESTIWLYSSVVHALLIGFSVLCSHKVGARDQDGAVKVFIQSLLFMMVLIFVFVFFGVIFNQKLPIFLGGQGIILEKASSYFLIIVLGMPFFALMELAAIMMQAHGLMKVTGFLNVLSCLFDVIFNYILIFPSHEIDIYSFVLCIPGFNLGIEGAALGTVLSYAVTALLFFIYIIKRTDFLKFKKEHLFPDFRLIKNALKISLPIALQNALMMSALIISTKIVAPLGNIALATNSFAITAESICFMAAYGLQGAACAIIGQAYGARNRRLTLNFAWICACLGMLIMTVSGIIMFIIAPYLMALLTPDESIQELGAYILRIEAFAEPLFGASIVIAGVFRGTGDTFIPGILNLVSIYGVRLPLAYILAIDYALTGVWIAMAVELCVRGLLFIKRLKGRKWLLDLNVG